MNERPDSYAEGVVFDASHIPGDYVALKDYHQNCKRHHNALTKACAANKIRRIRFRRSASDKYGFLYVHQADAAAIVADSDAKFSERDEAGDSHGQCDMVPAAETLASIEVTLDNLCVLLERMTIAVESIATQPNVKPAGA